MIQVNNYLTLPTGYTRWLGGLRWGIGDDAIEYPDGSTYAFSREISRFLDGYASHGPLLEFVQILHAFQLFSRGPLSPGIDLGDLVELFRATGRPLRNAGAFAAELCRSVPADDQAPPASEICLKLNRGAVGDVFGDPYAAALQTWEIDISSAPTMEVDCLTNDPSTTWPRQPAFSPTEFEAAFATALATFSHQERKHWLRFGRGSTGAGDEIAREVDPARPASLWESLESALDRPRLAGAKCLVDQIAGALALPPRRLDQERLPTGGYTDLATRGNPERILPSQLALEPEEFLRRFAEGELLFFHREEPHTPQAEELVLVVDQGVRTWGSVRLILAAAAVALGRLAGKGSLPLSFWATSAPGQPLGSAMLSGDQLGDLLEKSDLTQNPAIALQLAVAAGSSSGKRRDILLLTHPRSLIETVETIEKDSVPPESRLFAVCADDRGRVAFSQIRQGRQVLLSEFRIQSTDPPARPRRTDRSSPDSGWSGDVEPIGFPLRILPQPLQKPKDLYEFDISGNQLLVVGSLGLLHLYPLDAGCPETLPRPFHDEKLLGIPTALFHTASGFVLVYRTRNGIVLASYNLANRTVRVHPTQLSPDRGAQWFNLPERHLLIEGQGDDLNLFRLGSDQITQKTMNDTLDSEEFDALAWARGQAIAPPAMIPIHEGEDLPSRGPWIRLRGTTGTLLLQGVAPTWRPFAPISDGQPLLKDHRILRAEFRAGCLAIGVAGPSSPPRILIFRGPGLIMPEIAWTDDSDIHFRLSPDARSIALRSDRGIGVHSAAAPGDPCLFVSRQLPGTPRIFLGRDWLAMRDSSGNSHMIRWNRDQLDHHSARTESNRAFFSWIRNRPEIPPVLGASAKNQAPELTAYDPDRFPTVCRGHGLCAVGDRFGQVILLDARGNLVAVLCIRGHWLAAWLPDGTRYGPQNLHGAPPTPGAADRIAQRLREVSRSAGVGAWS